MAINENPIQSPILVFKKNVIIGTMTEQLRDYFKEQLTKGGGIKKYTYLAQIATVENLSTFVIKSGDKSKPDVRGITEETLEELLKYGDEDWERAYKSHLQRYGRLSMRLSRVGLGEIRQTMESFKRENTKIQNSSGSI